MIFGKNPPPPMNPNGMTPPPPMGGNGAPPPMGYPQQPQQGNMGYPQQPQGMAPAGGVVNLTKGQKVDLTKGNANLTQVMIGLGWDVNRYSGGGAFDLDASAFLVDQSGRSNPQNFIFYNNLVGINQCIVHQGDNTTGIGDGDDESILIDFTRVPPDVHKIAITVTINDADLRRQNFGMVENSYVRVLDNVTGREMIRYNLGEDFSVETALVVCELYRAGQDWKFAAIASGFSGGLAALCHNYGIQTS